MNKYKLIQDWGVTATIVIIILIGSFAILYRIADKIDPGALVTLVGGWISTIVGAIVILKAVKKPKE